MDFYSNLPYPLCQNLKQVKQSRFVTLRLFYFCDDYVLEAVCGARICIGIVKIEFE